MCVEAYCEVGMRVDRSPWVEDEGEHGDDWMMMRVCVDTLTAW